MKKSRYNQFVHWKDFYCGVNLFTGHKVILRQQDYETFLTNPQTIDTTLYTALIEGRFLVNDDDDEYAKILHRRNGAVFFNNNCFQLTILPTLECNFRCWYCYEQHPDSVMTRNTYAKIIKYIDYIVAHYPLFNFHLDWFGGEPLLYFNEIVKPISLYVKSVCLNHNLSFRNTMTTNGYLIDDMMIADFNEIELNRFQITLDGYKDLHNKTRFEKRGDDSYVKIIENINKICSQVKDAAVNIRINYTNKNIQNLGLIVDDIFSENRDHVYIYLQRVCQTMVVENDNDIDNQLNEQITYLQERGIHVNYGNIAFCQGVRCYADSIRQSVVNYDGSLYKCTARNFADNKASVGYLNNAGEPIWNANYYKHYLRPVFENAKCRECQFLPICLGVCSQKYIEGGDNAIRNECNPKGWEENIHEELLQTLYDYIIANQPV